VDAVTYGATTVLAPGDATPVPAVASEMVAEARGVDAFGSPRTRDWSASTRLLHPGGEYGVATDAGFTGHEHLDETQLIHMNGRVYDYALGRFLTVDPVVDGHGSQALNPYSYIGNNPLSGTDPTGYAFIEREKTTGSNIAHPVPTASDGGVAAPSMGSNGASTSAGPTASTRPAVAANESSPAKISTVTDQYHYKYKIVGDDGQVKGGAGRALGWRVGCGEERGEGDLQRLPDRDDGEEVSAQGRRAVY
jgi:RHS repeat-associated protein